MWLRYVAVAAGLLGSIAAMVRWLRRAASAHADVEVETISDHWLAAQRGEREDQCL